MRRLGKRGDEPIDEQVPTVDPPAPCFGREPLTGIWAAPVNLPTLRDPAAYTLSSVVGARIFDAPGAALPRATPGARAAYCRHSADVAMRGGTTSAVVYPLAICEIARRFRLRNVGGASAGAIGAATAAAAELGRSSGSTPTARPAQAVEQGRLRSGFVGLADSIAWIAETDTDLTDTGPRYRLAQLFRPEPSTLPLYRIVVAAMRKRWQALFLLAGGFLGRVSSVIAVLAFVATVVGLTWFTHSSQHGLFGQGVANLAGLLGLTGAVVGLLLVGLTVAGLLKSNATPTDLGPPVLHPVSGTGRQVAMLAAGVAALVAGGGLLALPAAASGLGLRRYSAALPLAWLALLVVLALVNVVRLYRLAFVKARDAKFGFIGGAATVDAVESGRRRFWNRVAGMAKPSVELAVVPWLSRALSDLAAMPANPSAPHANPLVGQVLRFGHLWFGPKWTPVPTLPPHQKAAAIDTRHRRVNLELMTSELTHGVSYRFPLHVEEQSDELPDPADPTQMGPRPTLYLHKPDLAAVFPDDVVAALTEGTSIAGHDIDDGKEVTDLYPLPEPWNLPVVFAVRLSMALPALLQAVRAYRIVRTHEVRDEYGAQLLDFRKSPVSRVEYPGGKHPNGYWVEQLWFSDGGITSNFPIHFFDRPLPEWPTLGVNLAPHPRGFEAQDVWLPSDWQSGTSPASPLQPSMASFVGAIVNTARSWRDTGQTFMPAFRGRVAWVRQRSDEGGANLFMTPETIASLALRGALAGARLRRRFATEAQWQRHQWIRFRIALDNLDRLQRDVGDRLGRPVYATLTGAAGLDPIKSAFVDPVTGDPAVPATGDPGVAANDQWADELDTDFWSAAGTLRARFTTPDVPESAALQHGAPYPAPDLRQVPPQ